MADAYWVGQDGNVYLKGTGGVQNLGAATDYELSSGAIKAFSDRGTTNTNAQSIASGVGSVLANQIADPNAPTRTAPTSTAPAKVLNQGAVNNTQVAIDQLPALLQSALEAEGQNYRNTTSQFDAEEGQQRGTYDKSTVTNQQNYDANFMDSIRAGIKGLGGLFAALRGSGAAGGTAEDQVRDVVGGVTANDIRTGADTQEENQGSLDAGLSTFLTTLKGKRQANEDTRVNNERAIRRDNATQLQDLYGKMAGYYGDADRTAERDDFMARAGSLTPQIAADTRTQRGAYDTTPVAVQAPNLTAFAAPSQPEMGQIPQDGQVGSGIFTINNKRRDQQAQPLALAPGA